VGKWAAGLKAAALARMIPPASMPTSADDPRIVKTSAGLAIIYTVARGDTTFTHHCSVSVPGGPTLHAVGWRFVPLVAKLVGLPLERMAFEIGKSTVHHGEVVLSQIEHEAVALAPIPEVSTSNLAEWRLLANDHRAEWKRSEA
jgi:hypothetical protein